MELKKIFGIDLGTTYSCISYVDESGRPVIVKNSEGSNITPSVVFFDEGAVVVGDVAKENAALYPEKVVSFIKRSIGEEGYRFYHEDKELRAEEISAYILKKLVKDAELELNEKIEDVVITCPAYFGINEREATKQAGIIAGLNVKQIINEPTAAAISYGSIEENQNKVVLVYDLGGGTFDITMIEIKENEINVICTGGDHNLGGKNWDDAILTYLAEKFQEQSGIDEDILDNLETLQDLMVQAEKAKKQLTQRDKTTITVNFDGNRERIELTREKFEELTAPLLERTVELTKDMLSEASKKGYNSFDEILLVGGSTRMPQIMEKIRSEFSVEPRVFDPDEAVAKGAAIFGNNKAIQDLIYKTIEETTSESVDNNQPSEGAIETAISTLEDAGYCLGGNIASIINVKINNVTSKSFGVAVINREGERVISNIITKNTTVPVTETKTFGTQHENQLDVYIEIFENEVSDLTCEVENGKSIGTAILELPEGLPAHSPIEVRFTLNEEGILEMTAIEVNSGKEIHVTIEVTGSIKVEELEEIKNRTSGTLVE